MVKGDPNLASSWPKIDAKLKKNVQNKKIEVMRSTYLGFVGRIFCNASTIDLEIKNSSSSNRVKREKERYFSL